MKPAEETLPQALAAAKALYKQSLELAVKHRQAPTALGIFVGLARLLVEAGELPKASELLALVMHHSASTFETKEKARQLLANLNVDLSSEAKRKEHQTVDWQATVREWVDALTPLN